MEEDMNTPRFSIRFTPIQLLGRTDCRKKVMWLFGVQILLQGDLTGYRRLPVQALYHPFLALLGTPSQIPGSFRLTGILALPLDDSPNSSCFYQYSPPLCFLFLITPVPIPQPHLSVMSILFTFKGRFTLLNFSGSVHCSMTIIYFKANNHLKVKKVHAIYTYLSIYFFLLFHLFPTFISFCFIPMREGRNHHFKLYTNAYTKSVVRQQ